MEHRQHSYESPFEGGEHLSHSIVFSADMIALEALVDELYRMADARNNALFNRIINSIEDENG